MFKTKCVASVGALSFLGKAITEGRKNLAFFALVCGCLALAPLACIKKTKDAGSGAYQASGAGEYSPLVINPLEASDRTATDIYKLVPEHNPDHVISFPDLIRLLTADADKKLILNHYLQQFQDATGIQIQLPNSDELLKSPEKLTDLLQVKLDAVDKARRLAVAHLAAHSQPVVHSYFLPQSFDWDHVGQVTVPPTSADMQQVVKGVYRGWPVNQDLPEEARRASTILSEVVERLAVNDQLAASEKFTFTYQHQSFSDLRAFISNLSANGHDIAAEVHHFVANFAGLNVMGTDGIQHGVAAPLFVRTGFMDKNGLEAVLPALHSEIWFQIKPKDSSKGNQINSTFVFYQGVGKTGFYCEDCSRRDAWVGKHSSYPFTADGAPQALILAGKLTSVIRTVALNEHLAMDGYGATGVCNDSVGVIQYAVAHQVNSYPLLMLADILVPEIDKRIAMAQNSADQANDYLSLKMAVAAIPHDTTRLDDGWQRALLSMPWEPGAEPFFSSVSARAILTGFSKGQ